MRHTNALTYSLSERIYFQFFGHWPDSVVRRRLAAADLDQIESSRAFHEALASRADHVEAVDLDQAMALYQRRREELRRKARE